MADAFTAWLSALEKRHLANLTFQEVRRSVQALSAIYVENRNRLDSGAVLNGAGKRAAFALFYAPLHFLLIREIVRALNAAEKTPSTIVDLGCGTGVAGAAWALEFEDRSPKLIGMDVNSWTIQEAQWTYRTFGLTGTARVGDARKLRIPDRAGVVAAFTINELDEESRAAMLQRLLDSRDRGCSILVVEPIARRVNRWWDSWTAAFQDGGGRQDEWRFRVELPDNLKLMDKAAGLDHRELTGRSLWLEGAAPIG